MRGWGLQSSADCFAYRVVGVVFSESSSSLSDDDEDDDEDDDDVEEDAYSTIFRRFCDFAFDNILLLLSSFLNLVSLDRFLARFPSLNEKRVFRTSGSKSWLEGWASTVSRTILAVTGLSMRSLMLLEVKSFPVAVSSSDVEQFGGEGNPS